MRDCGVRLSRAKHYFEGKKGRPIASRPAGHPAPVVIQRRAFGLVLHSTAADFVDDFLVFLAAFIGAV